MDCIYGLASGGWVSAAKLLAEDGINPVYWVCPERDVERIKRAFPEATVHGAVDCIQGRYPEEYADADLFSYPIDEKMLEEFLWEESQVLKMMDRLDAGNVTGTEFTYTRRVRHYHRMLMYWKMVLEDIEPDLAIFGVSPHNVSDYLLYGMCKRNNVQTIIATPTSLPQTFYMRSELHELPDELQDLETVDANPSEELLDHLSRISGDYSEAKPDYMKSQNQSRRGLVRRLAKRTAARLASPRKYGYYIKEIIRRTAELPDKINKLQQQQLTGYVRTRGNRIEDSIVRKWQWRIYRWKAERYKKHLKEIYTNLATVPNLSDRYIYLPFHYQPERTTAPEAGMFVHQYLMANLLSHKLPSGIKIIIKEHPSQFNSNLKGDQGREPEYYKDLKRISGVELASLDISTFDLIDNALAVATATGTAGWEALVRGTPALVFGTPWYRPAPGCCYIKHRSEMSRSLQYINSNPTVHRADIESFVAAVERVGYNGELPPNGQQNDKQQSKTLYQAVTDRIP